MRKTELEKMTIAELVEKFAEIGIAQDDALFHSRYAKFNQLYGQMDKIDGELRSRGLEARRALMALYDHDNMQVRLKAAVRTLAVAPVEARRLLQAIYDSKFYPQAGDAGMTLSNLDNGIFKPD